MRTLKIGLAAATLAVLSTLAPQAHAGSFKDDFLRQLAQFDTRRLEDGLTISIHACAQNGRRNRHTVRQNADINIGACVQAGEDNDLTVIQNGGINLFRYRQRSWRR